MQVIDASSIIHAWDNYPIENFPTFWKWIDEGFSAKKLIIPGVAFDEVGHVSPDCYEWLRESLTTKQDVNAIIAAYAQNI